MARQDRIAQLIALLEDAITTGNDDLAQEVRSDLFREYGLDMNRGGMATMDYMTRPIYMEGGGLLSSVGNLDIKVKKLELMQVLSLAEIDELDNMSASQIDKLYKEKFGE